jgi:hypothetical protein
MKYQISWTPKHAEIFENFITALNNHDVKYFILRNYETLPAANNSKDVDIIIKPGSFNLAYGLLYRILNNHQIDYIHRVRYERVNCCYGISPKKKFSIHIDLIEGYLSKGFEVFPFEVLYKNTVPYNNFRVLTPSLDAALLLYYKVISTHNLAEKYKNKIEAIFIKDPIAFNEILSDTLSKKISTKLYNDLSNKNFEQILSYSKKISNFTKL